jgi:hypothetical protein
LLFIVPVPAASRLLCEVHLAVFVFIGQESVRQGSLTSKFAVTAVQSRFKCPTLGNVHFFVLSFIINVAAAIIAAFPTLTVAFEVVSKQVNACCVLGIFVQIVYIARNLLVKVFLVVLLSHSKHWWRRRCGSYARYESLFTQFDGSGLTARRRKGRRRGHIVVSRPLTTAGAATVGRAVVVGIHILSKR